MQALILEEGSGKWGSCLIKPYQALLVHKQPFSRHRVTLAAFCVKTINMIKAMPWEVYSICIV